MTTKKRKRAFLSYFPGIVLLVDGNGAITAANPSVTATTGYDENAMVGHLYLEFIHPEDQAAVAAGFAEVLQSPEGAHTSEVRFRHQDGHWLTVDAVARNALAEPTLAGILIDIRDITERRQSEQGLKLFRALVDNALDAIEVVDPATLRYIDANQTACDVLGYSRDELLALKVTDIDVGLDQAGFERIVGQLTQSGEVHFRSIHRHKDGSRYPVEVDIKQIRLDRLYNVVVVHDITERTRAEQNLKRLNWALQALSQSNAALIRAGSEQTLYQLCCEAITGVDVYPLAWIGTARKDAAHTVEIMAIAGVARDYLEGLELSWSTDTVAGRGPAGITMRTGTTQVLNDLASSRVYRPWRERARVNGLASLMTTPIRIGDEVPGVLAVYSDAPAAFDDDEVRVLGELAADMGYGISTRRIQRAYEESLEQHAQQAAKLRATFESAITALAATAEQRDPYTAGHQRRVADLAVTIGHELGLDADRSEGLRIAASIHDIGKIYVPGEILVRPGKLSAIEFEIVKSHVQVGYDIVRKIDSPWPVAEIVYQHHERLDGSGYPRGLKADDIILEARILAVADTVEAMSSHRPYRPGLGLDAALAQVQSDAGTKLDPGAVAACIRLFRDKGYQLPDC